MKTFQVSLIAVTAIIILACNTSKKSSSSTVSSVPPATSPAPAAITSTTSFMVPKSADGIYAPGNPELAAIQTQYKDLTLDKLNQGYVIYTMGACIKCHGAQSIYMYGETRWKDIIDNMAQKARISDEQKDAVYKYVLSIKATQPK